jgi:hypothetical protein
MVHPRKNLNEVSGTSPTISLSIQPRAHRPPGCAAYVGCTPFAIEEAWRDGSLKYLVIGGSRVSTTQQLDEWIDSLEEQSGRLPGRGKFRVEAA